MTLRVIQPAPARPLSLAERTAREVGMLEGFYALERDGVHEFRWMQEQARLGFEPEDRPRFLELPLFTSFLDLSQELTVEVAGQATTQCLVPDWSLLSCEIPPGAEEVALSVNKIFPRCHYPGDSRTLAIRVGIARLHADPDRHRSITAVWHNGVLNRREMQAGRALLESTPPSLGIDMHGACNVKPPCVYCDWDTVKEEEGDLVDAPFTRETLEEWGPFFENAESLFNCGIGEPFMMKNLDELLDVFGEREKTLEMATNGQILTDRNIERLVGRKVRLFISLDAATPETYAMLRNDTFPKILENVRRLIAAKGGRGKYPLVWLNFMPMKANAHELEGFVKLCAELEVDQMVLRPLNYYENKPLNWERAGYSFVYEDELLPFSELIHISGRAAELCQRYGVSLGDFLDDGDAGLEEYFPEAYADGRREAESTDPVEEASVAQQADTRVTSVVEGELPASVATPSTPIEPAGKPADDPVSGAAEASLGDPKLPICLEPWKHIYILRRGVLPCCYGHPLEPMDRWEEVWNSPKLQEIRTELAAGRLHSYCLESTTCPIVRKRLHGSRLPARQALPLKLRRLAHRADRLAFGAPGTVYRGLRSVLQRLGREPAHSRDDGRAGR